MALSKCVQLFICILGTLLDIYLLTLSHHVDWGLHLLVSRVAALHQPRQVEQEQNHQGARGEPDGYDITVFFDVTDDSLVDPYAAVDKDDRQENQIEAAGQGLRTFGETEAQVGAEHEHPACHHPCR